MQNSLEMIAKLFYSAFYNKPWQKIKKKKEKKSSQKNGIIGKLYNL